MNIGPQIKALLKQYGLEGLEQWASLMSINGASAEEIELSLYDQPAFKERFWMLFQHQANGFGAISPAEVLDYENNARQLASSFGLKVTDHDIGDWIANGKGLPEQQSRMELASKAVYQTDVTTRAQLQDRYGISTGDLTSYFLDPKKTLQDLQRRYVQADIAGAANRSGFQQRLSEENLGTLYDRGITGDTAGDLFTQLQQGQGLFEAVDETEQDLSVDDQVALVTGDANVQQSVQRRADKRKAQFQQGGGYATTKLGVGGLGSANT